MLSNKIFAKRKEPIFQIPDTAKTREAIEAYVGQYVKDSIAWQERKFQKWKKINIEQPINSEHRLKENRRWVIIWSFVSALLFGVLVYTGMLPITSGFQELLTFDYLPASWPSAPPAQPPQNTPMFFGLIALLITAPVAYAIWTIRDENAAQTLENARKDTNLKDFQRLSEWASGFHLPEDKIVSLSKTISKETETTTEKSTTTETYSAPEDAQQISRRMGAESLQVAAIYQLQAFMRGAYGEQFMKPAFYMLFGMWQTKMKSTIDQLKPETPLPDMRQHIAKAQNEPTFKAIQDCITADSGMYLRLFRNALPNSCLAGLSMRHGALNLAGIELRGIDLRFCDLGALKLDGCNLDGVNLSHAVIGKISLLKATATGNAQFLNFGCDEFNAQFAFFDYCNFRDFFYRELHVDGCKITSRTIFGKTNPNLDLPPMFNSFGTAKMFKSDFVDHSKIQKELLNTGAILVDSKTGEPIKPK